MATIRKRRKKDGSFSYIVQIRIALHGLDHSESRSFPRKAMAEEWAKRRELELASPAGVAQARWKGLTLDDAIERYLHEFAQDAGRSKRAIIEQLCRFPISRIAITELTSERVIEHAVMRRDSGIKPSTINQDVVWLGIILKTAAAAWKMPVELERIRAYFQRSQRIRPSAIIPMEDIMDFTVATSRRQEEITRLLWSDLDDQAMTCWVRDAKHPRQKWGNHKRFKLTHEAMAIIKRQPRSQGEDRIFPYNGKSIGTRLWHRGPAPRSDIPPLRGGIRDRRGSTVHAARELGRTEAVYASSSGKVKTEIEL